MSMHTLFLGFDRITKEYLIVEFFVWVMFESKNPPIPLMHARCPNMSNLSPYKQNFNIGPIHINYSIGLLFDCEIVCVSHVWL